MDLQGQPRMNLRALASMVKLSHSLFALPFVAAAVVLVARDASLDLRRLALVAIAVVAARTAAMTMNRIADRKFDEKNPRTIEARAGDRGGVAGRGVGAPRRRLRGLHPLGGAPPAPRRLALAARPRGPPRLQLREALHVGVPPLARRRAGARADRRGDRADRRRAARLRRPRARRRRLDRRLRPVLGAAGRRLRPERRAPLHPGPLRREGGAPWARALHAVAAAGSSPRPVPRGALVGLAGPAPPSSPACSSPSTATWRPAAS